MFLKLIKYSNISVLGSGPSGYTSSIYLYRFNLNPLLITGNKLGGQLINSDLIENWPTFIKIKGIDLMKKFLIHIENFNIELSYDEIFNSNCFLKTKFLIGANKIYYISNILIICTGSSYNYLKILNFNYKNISFCGTCDGNFYLKKNVLIIGGGYNSVYNSILLSKITNKIFLLNRKNYFKSDYLQILNLFKNKNNIKIYLNCIVIEFLSNSFRLKYVKLKNLINNYLLVLFFSGLFFFIGHKINISFILGQIKTILKHIKIEMNLKSYLTKTNINNVFSSGDVQDFYYKQAIISSGFGSISALDTLKKISINN